MPGRVIKKNNKPRPPAARAVRYGVMAGIAVLLGARLLFAVPSSSPARFKGYLTVAYRGARPLAELADFLSVQPDIETVISAATAHTLHTDFGGLVQVPLARVGERFDERDPRLDEYLKDLPRYFTMESDGAAWHLLYVAGRRNALSLSLLLASFAGDSGRTWKIAERDDGGTSVLVAVAGTLFFLAVMSGIRNTAGHVLFGAGILPWMIAMTHGSIAEFLIFFFMSFFWAEFLKVYLEFVENAEWAGWKDTDRKPVWLRLSLHIGIIVVALVYSSFQRADLLEITLALLAQIGLLAAHWWGVRLLKRLSRRPPPWRLAYFRPLTILRLFERQKPKGRARPVAAHAAVGLLVLMPLVLLIRPQADSGGFPVPEKRIGGAGISLASLRELATAHRPGDLPDLSDFVRHAAYQERLAYGAQASYELPGRDEAIVLSAYREILPGGRVEKTPRPVLSFDDAWLGRLVERTGRVSVERMLADQGEGLSVAGRRDTGIRVLAENNWTILIVWSIVLVPVILLKYTAIPRLIYGRRTQLTTSIKSAAGPAVRKTGGPGKKTAGNAPDRKTPVRKAAAGKAPVRKAPVRRAARPAAASRKPRKKG